MANDEENPVEVSQSIDSLLDDDGVLDSNETLIDDPGGDSLNAGIEAGDRYSPGERFGTTLAEEREGESLDQLLAEEEPDIDYRDGSARDDSEYRPAGRLVAEDEGAHSVEDADLVGEAVGIDGGGQSAEEDAIHIVDGD